VSDALHITTSTVSQQLAVLAKEVGATLVEPDGRRVRLTPAGRRLAEHALVILTAVEAARADLDPAAEPTGTLRVAGFATAIRRSLLPIIDDLAVTHPRVRLVVHEHEPAESLELLATDDVDLALVYDYNLAPAAVDPAVESIPLWTAAWALGVPVAASRTASGSSHEVFARFRDDDWIVNSRNTADENVIRTVAAMADFRPKIAHQVDTLELVQDLIVAGLGVGLLPAAGTTLPGVGLLPLTGPDITLRSYAMARRGRTDWPPLALVLDALARQTPAAPRDRAAGGSPR
jgi:DNA-binding transcriptional LysR family regulator